MSQNTHLVIEPQVLFRMVFPRVEKQRLLFVLLMRGESPEAANGKAIPLAARFSVRACGRAVALDTGREQIQPPVRQPIITGVPALVLIEDWIQVFIGNVLLGTIVLDVAGLVSREAHLTIGALAVKKVEQSLLLFFVERLDDLQLATAGDRLDQSLAGRVGSLLPLFPCGIFKLDGENVDHDSSIPLPKTSAN
jgi:hypothetical protein